MTEADWLRATSPDPMLAYLDEHPEAAGERKRRLLAAAWCRRVAYLLPGEIRAAMDVLERYAEAMATPRQLWEVRMAALDAEDTGDEHAARAVYYAAAQRLEWEGVGKVSAAASGGEAGHAADQTRTRGAAFVTAHAEASEVVACAQADLIRECLGNPFRPASVSETWLTWANGIVAGLAGAIHEDRAFDRLPILADALEEAGCDDAAILNHCRGPGPHVLGCWVVDLLLGKQ